MIGFLVVAVLVLLGGVPGRRGRVVSAARLADVIKKIGKVE